MIEKWVLIVVMWSSQTGFSSTEIHDMPNRDQCQRVAERIQEMTDYTAVTDCLRTEYYHSSEQPG